MKFTCIILIVLVFFSCKKKDDDPDMTYILPPYNFTDQDLQGEIAGDTWEYQSGRIHKNADSEEYWVDIWDVEDTTDCGWFYPESRRLIFLTSLREGLVRLSPEGKKVTYIENGEKYILFEGAVEITSVDTSSSPGMVEGRMDARAENFHRINGNFTLNYCN